MPALSDQLKVSFRDKEYRHVYVEDFSINYIATQIKILREQRGWNQSDLAEKAGMKQSAISRLEDVNYSSWNIKTLQRLAEAFDLTLRISFEGFGERLDDILEFSKESLERLSFEDDPVFETTSEATLTSEIRESFNPVSPLRKNMAEFDELLHGRRKKIGAELALEGEEKTYEGEEKTHAINWPTIGNREQLRRVV